MKDLKPVNILVAHTLEAKPLIAYLDLKKLQLDSPFAHYENSQGLHLVISGMGKLAMTAAVAYLAALQSNDNELRAWVNVGIAGHGDQALGTGLLVNKITDGNTQAALYPPACMFRGMATTALITVDKPELNYPTDAAYDMEAYGFYHCANRFVTAELVQVFKIISDNRKSSIDNITPAAINTWIQSNLQMIGELIEHLSEELKRYNEVYAFGDEYQQIVATMRMSKTLKSQFSKAYRRYYALGNKDLTASLDVENISNIRELLAKMNVVLKPGEV